MSYDPKSHLFNIRAAMAQSLENLQACSFGVSEKSRQLQQNLDDAQLLIREARRYGQPVPLQDSILAELYSSMIDLEKACRSVQRVLEALPDGWPHPRKNEP